MEYALNLCDMMMEIDECKMSMLCEQKQFNRIYVGSYFCSFYFSDCNKYENIINYARRNNLSVTLVIPVIAQSIYEKSIMKINEMIVQYWPILDEIVCNDVAMYNYIEEAFSSVKLVRGRIFDRHNKEERNGLFDTSLFPDNRICEIDGDWAFHIENNRQIESCENIYIHYPFYYITYGRICLYSSIGEPTLKKFRPNRCRSMKCIGRTMKYIINGNNEVFRRGCAIYGKAIVPHNSIEVFGRIIETPYEFEVKE